NLGIAVAKSAELDAAIEHFRHALALRPDDAAAQSGLGNIYKDKGKLSQAIACYRRALEVAPQDQRAAIHSNLIYAMHFQPGVSADAIAAEHRRWVATHASKLEKFSHESHDGSGDRRLKIGY